MEPTSPVPPESRTRPAWSTGRAPNSLAALPTGLLGRLGGEIMRRTNSAEQREVADVLETLLERRREPWPDGAAPASVEVGCGPGVLLRMLAGRPGVGRLEGIDPSRTMRVMAVRALARHVADDRVRIRPGDAERTGLPDGAVDVVVSVNTVAIWPDLDAGLDELCRVLRPGGSLVLSWHGGTDPGRSARSLRLPPEQLDHIEAATAARLVDVRRVETRRCTVVVGVRTS